MTKDIAAAYLIGFDTAQRLQIGKAFNRHDAQLYLGNGCSEEQMLRFLDGGSDYLSGDYTNKRSLCRQILES